MATARSQKTRLAGGTGAAATTEAGISPMTPKRAVSVAGAFGVRLWITHTVGLPEWAAVL